MPTRVCPTTGSYCRIVGARPKRAECWCVPVGALSDMLSYAAGRRRRSRREARVALFRSSATQGLSEARWIPVGILPAELLQQLRDRKDFQVRRHPESKPSLMLPITLALALVAWGSLLPSMVFWPAAHGLSAWWRPLL